MASLHIIVGRDGDNKPSVLYCGESGVDAKKAMDESKKARRFLILRNPEGYTKNNPKFLPIEAPPEKDEAEEEGEE